MTRTELAIAFQLNIEKISKKNRSIDLQDVHISLWRTFKNIKYINMFDALEAKDHDVPIILNFKMIHRKDMFLRAFIEISGDSMYDIVVNAFHAPDRQEQIASLYHEMRHLRQDLMQEYSSWSEENKRKRSFSEAYDSDSEIDARKAEKLSYTHDPSRLTVFDYKLSFYQS